MSGRRAVQAGVALLLTAGSASAQVDTWTAECAANGACVARTQQSYRPSAGGAMFAAPAKTMTATIRDDAQKPLVTIEVNDTEVRYAQMRIDRVTKTAELVCGEKECGMGYADARATIDALKSGLGATVMLFTNNGQVVQVRLPTAGFGAAAARTRTN